MLRELITPVILGIVEGITEFLPVSSTGHLIILNEFTDFTGPFAKMFDVVIQLGAILAVVVYYRKRLFYNVISGDGEERRRGLSLWLKAAVGVVPALVLGYLFGKQIQELLFNPYVVATALVVGGVVLIIIERTKKTVTISDVDGLDYKTVLLVGLVQCLAMVPGTSRSAATIIGAMALGASRTAAAEFSFFLAIPTMAAASGYALMKNGAAMTGFEAVQLAVGFVVSFITAYLVIAAFIRFISRHDFVPFGVYRIALGVAVLAYFMLR
jgi:undecaprenyl-diphosphatase